MSSRAHLPVFSREEIAYRNAIAQNAAPLRVAFADGEWKLELVSVAQSSLNGETEYLEADWGGARYTVAARPALAQRFLRHVLPDADSARLPEALRLAALESLRGELERALRLKGAAPRPLRLDALGTSPAAHGARHRYAFALTSDKSGETISGEVSTDVLGLSFAAPLLKAAARDEAPAADWLEQLPVPVRFDVGATTLAADELRALGLRDVVLFDESGLGAGAELSLAVGPKLAFRGRLEGRTITVTQPLGKIMAESTSAPAAGAKSDKAEVGAIDQVPVRLTFDLGERSLTLAELRALKPGFTFDLGRDLRRAVSIRANGQPIGEGELVEIDGVLGVAVTALGPRA